MAAMRAGDFARAWALSDTDLHQRITSGAAKHEGPRHCQNIWRGEPLAGARVLVRCYHGLGDTIQFVRFASPLRRIAREVILWAQPELMTLLIRAPGIDRILPLHEGTPDVDYDVDIEIMEIAHALRVTPDSLGSYVPYLTPPPDNNPPFAADRLHVGLVWQAGDWDPHRSMDVGQLTPLAHIPRVSFYSLQPGADLATVPFAITDLSESSIEAAAATICRLDLVITVDTMIAHLAGALGRPVWTMLHAACDWRWMETGRHTPWYPDMRLFRQKAPGDWASVVDELAVMLRHLAPATVGKPQEQTRQHGVMAKTASD